MKKIIIVDICNYILFFIKFLRSNNFLKNNSVVNSYISNSFKKINLEDSKMEKLKKKLLFKTRILIYRARLLGYLEKIGYNTYKIIKKNEREFFPLIIDLFNLKISNFTIITNGFSFKSKINNQVILV
ncbi:MAG: hypothetical protein ACTSRP_19565 [Candidatus Helarchaeota archaeon]